MKLEVVYEGIEPGSCRNWNYRIEDREGNVHYCGVTINVKERARDYCNKRTQIIHRKMHERGIENFVMVVHDGDNDSSKEKCRRREIKCMHRWRTIRSQYPDNPHASNIVSKMGMHIYEDLPKEKQAETRRKISNSNCKKFSSHMDAWVFRQVHVLNLSHSRVIEMIGGGKTDGYIKYCAKRHLREYPSAENEIPPPSNQATFTPEQEDRIYDQNYNQGVRIRELASEHQCSYGAIMNAARRSMRRNGIEFKSRRPKKLTPDQVEYVFEQVCIMGERKCALRKKFNVAQGPIDNAIMNVAKRRGIDLPDCRSERFPLAKELLIST